MSEIDGVAPDPLMTFAAFCEAVERAVRPSGASPALRTPVGDLVWQHSDYRCSIEPYENGLRCRLWHASNSGLTTQNIDLELTEHSVGIVAATIASMLDGP
jgi:hypothetical protein